MLNLTTHLILGLSWLFINFSSFSNAPQSAIKADQSASFFRFIQLLILFSALYSMANEYWRFESISLFNLNFSAAGFLLSSLGLFLYYRAKKDLGNSFSPCFNMKLPENFVTSGLYAKVRNPIYSANLMFVAGLGLSTRSWVMIAATLILYLSYSRAVALEEGHLCKIFPEYQSYAKKTGRFFPRID